MSMKNFYTKNVISIISLSLLIGFGLFNSTSFNSPNRSISRSIAQEYQDVIEAKYGPEFSFTNDELVKSMKNATDYNNPTNVNYLERWKDLFEKLCIEHDCNVSPGYDKHGKAYRVTFPDGWWFQAGVDTGCLEVQAMPSTLSGFKMKQDILEAFIFNGAKEINLKPHSRIGGGHVNIDFETGFAGGDAKLFRNFVVDQANHPELIWGIFGNHIGNAPPISALEPRLHDELKAIIDEFDNSGESSGGVESIQKLAKEIEDRVYVSNPFWLMQGKKIWSPSYYQHMSFRSIKAGTEKEMRRIELRGFRPQQNLNEFFLEMEFLDARLTYLKRLDEPLPLNIPLDYEMPVSHKIEKFKKLISETNLDQKKFSYFLSGPIGTGRFNIPNQPRSCHTIMEKILNR